jgi:hypothetical protein
MRIGSGSNVDQSRRVDHALVPDGHELKSRELGHDRKDEFSAPRQVDARQLPLLPPDSGKPSLFEKGTRFVTEKALPVLGGLAGAGGLAAYLIGTGGLGIFVPLLLAGLAGGVGGKLASGILRWGNNKAFTLDEKAKAALQSPWSF